MKLSIASVLLLLTLSTNAQTEIWVEARGKAGFLAAHRAVMGHLVEQHAFATEISYILKADGSKAWHGAYKNPLYGVTFFHGSVGNRELMGNYSGLYGFLDLPILKTKHYTFSGKLGCGLGYAPKVYDSETNPYSIGVSTHFNALVSLAVQNRWQFGNHSVSAVLDMTHFSNGATKVPNLGLNLPYFSIGYGYRVKNKKPDTVYQYPEFKKYWEFGGIALGSSKEVFPTGGKKYGVIGLNAVARRYFKRSLGLEMSIDFIYKDAIRAFQSDVPKSVGEIMQVGVFAGYLLPMNHFHLVTGMGYYVKDKFKPEDFLYHRVGMRYVFDNGLNLNLVLKSHWARADYIEYGLGYTFKR